MKTLAFLVLSLWASVAAAIAPNTTALYTLNNVITDSSGNGYTLSQTGTVPFATGINCGPYQYIAGPFSGANYLSSAALRAAMSGDTTYTLEFNVLLTAMAAEQILISAGSSNASSLVFAITAAGAVKLVTDDTNVYATANGTIANGICYYIAYVINGTNLKIYVSPYGQAPQLKLDTTATSPESPTAGSYFIGVYSLSLGFLPTSAGYLGNMRFSNVARTSLPTTDFISGETDDCLFMRVPCD